MHSNRYVTSPVYLYYSTAKLLAYTKSKGNERNCTEGSNQKYIDLRNNKQMVAIQAFQGDAHDHSRARRHAYNTSHRLDLSLKRIHQFHRKRAMELIDYTF